MPRTKKTETDLESPVAPNTSAQELIAALVAAINLTKPIEKKTPNTRKPGSPWDPKDGSKKLKLKRKMYQHGIIMDPDFLDNEEIDLLNKLKVGRFVDGWVKVYRRKDHGVDIDYPIKTASQRVKLMGIIGGQGLKGLLTRCINEAANPKSTVDADGDEA